MPRRYSELTPRTSENKFILLIGNCLLLLKYLDMDDLGDESLKKILFNPNRLKAERIARNISQEELAIKLGKNRTWLAKRENGNVDVGADELAAIATALKVDDLSIFFT